MTFFRLMVRIIMRLRPAWASVAFALLLGGCCHVSSTESGRLSLEEMSLEQGRVWLKGASSDWRKDTAKARGLPAPSDSIPLAPRSQVIDLEEPDLEIFGKQGLSTALANRRSHRDYLDTPLTLEELGFLLWSAQGINAAELDDEGNVIRTYRTAPSAGGLYPLETYVIVQRVANLEAGIYRYRSREHQLVLVKEGVPTKELQRACYGSSAVEQAAVTVVWTAVPARTEWKYGSIAHRMIAMEAGHACQNLYLAAGTIDCGACALLAYDQNQLDQILELNEKLEFVLYLATVGKIK